MESPPPSDVRNHISAKAELLARNPAAGRLKGPAGLKRLNTGSTPRHNLQFDSVVGNATGLGKANSLLDAQRTDLEKSGPSLVKGPGDQSRLTGAQECPLKSKGNAKKKGKVGRVLMPQTPKASVPGNDFVSCSNGISYVGTLPSPVSTLGTTLGSTLGSTWGTVRTSSSSVSRPLPPLVASAKKENKPDQMSTPIRKDCFGKNFAAVTEQRAQFSAFREYMTARVAEPKQNNEDLSSSSPQYNWSSVGSLVQTLDYLEEIPKVKKKPPMKREALPLQSTLRGLNSTLPSKYPSHDPELIKGGLLEDRSSAGAAKIAIMPVGSFFEPGAGSVFDPFHDSSFGWIAGMVLIPRSAEKNHELPPVSLS